MCIRAHSSSLGYIVFSLLFTTGIFLLITENNAVGRTKELARPGRYI